MLEICDEKEKSSLYFSVQDDGIGIEEEKQKLIFQNFEQADESEIARRQETGLGLAISRRLIHLQFPLMISQVEKNFCPALLPDFMTL